MVVSVAMYASDGEDDDLLVVAACGLRGSDTMQLMRALLF
jgi:hypothetical protein